jgi:hypothetical protein
MQGVDGVIVLPSNTLVDQGDSVESRALTWHSSGQPITPWPGRCFPRTDDDGPSKVGPIVVIAAERWRVPGTP